MSLQDGLDKLANGSNQLLASPVATSIGGALVGGALVGTAIAVASSGKKKTRKTTRKKKSSRRKSSKRKGRRTPRTAGKGKDRSTKRIRYTKNGQPYVILRNGRARFIKASSARRSHKKKGGRY